jgi:hypothetical protein
VLSTGSYSVVAVDRPGSISGTVVVAGAATAPTNADSAENCEVQATSPGAGHTSTLGWVDGARAGRPLPAERRYRLESRGCALEPRLQGVVMGGAVNVANDDRTAHRLVFLRMGSGDTVQVMPFTHSGQLVATNQVTREPGIIEVRCAQHPWTRAYIAVFDHPYFAIASGGSQFTIDSIPLGSYRLRSWREGDRTPGDQPVDVAGGQRTTITLR